MPGEIIAYGPEGLDISTGDRALRILTLQLEGKKKAGHQGDLQWLSTIFSRRVNESPGDCGQGHLPGRR